MEPIRAIAVRPRPRESNALSARGTERSLTAIEQRQLDELCRQMQAHYPHQEFADETVRGYLFDLERLAVIHGIDVLQVALLNLRIEAGRKFFPHPSEIAEEIDAVQEARSAQRRKQREREQRSREIAEFWKWAGEWMHDTGNDEAELLNRYPSYRGTKPEGSK